MDINLDTINLVARLLHKHDLEEGHNTLEGFSAYKEVAIHHLKEEFKNTIDARNLDLYNGIIPKEEPKDWIITAFQEIGDNKNIFSLQSDGSYMNNNYIYHSNPELFKWKAQDFLNSDEIIYSVKVKQSNREYVEFKIGDKVTIVRGRISNLSYNHTIESIKIINNRYLKFFLNNSCTYDTLDGQDNMIHIKEPLFQLSNEKGEMVDMYEGDICWYVNQQLCYNQTKLAYINSNLNYFLLEKQCIEYIDKNKKVYSKQEILDALTDTRWISGTNTVINQIKEKLNL